MENAFAAHLIHQYIVYICMHCCTVGHDDDNAAGAAEAAETSGCRDGVPGMARGPTCAGPGSAAPLGT